MLRALLAAGLVGSTSVLHCISSFPLLCQRALHIHHAQSRNQCQSLHQANTGSSGNCRQASWRGPPLLHTSHRDFSSEQQHLTIKTALRQLYKRVHPDLFVDYPAEQVQTLTSSNTLQGLLDVLHSHHGAQPAHCGCRATSPTACMCQRAAG